jgi:hypothetical protein
MLQRAVTIGHNGGVVDVDINTILGGNEAVATLVVEPFYEPFHNSRCLFCQFKVTNFIASVNTIAAKKCV